VEQWGDLSLEASKLRVKKDDK